MYSYNNYRPHQGTDGAYNYNQEVDSTPNNHLRNQFLSNVHEDDDFNFQSPSRNPLPTPPKPSMSTNSFQKSAYSRTDENTRFPYGNSSSSVINSDTFDRKQYPYGTKNNGYVPSDPENVELSTLSRDVNSPLINPFEKNEPHNPFTDPIDPAATAAADPEYAKMRRNQRARMKQLRRYPRFHYANLPYFTILVTLIQVIVFIVELIKMAVLTGSAFQTQPYFNPMLGPSTYLLINMGARYVPCMHGVENITDDTTILFPCPNSTDTDTNVCPLSELCGLSGIPVDGDGYDPGQWYRIFIPIFLHAGFLHIIFNLLLQVTMGSTIEKNIGTLKYALIYIASGIGGFLLGSNFSPLGIASTGASGSLFGIMATNIILFVFAGKKNTNLYGTKKYGLFICIMIGEIVVSLVLGLLPGLDNFSHIGGFAVGVLMAVILLPDPFFVYEDGIITYNAEDGIMQQFVNNWNPLHNWQDKTQVRFLSWITARVVAFVLLIVYFVLLAKNFFGVFQTSTDNGCSWCKYINCIPVHGWCDIGQVTVSTESDDTTSSSSTPTSTSESSGSSLPGSITHRSLQRRQRTYEVFEQPLQNHIEFDTPKPTLGQNHHSEFGFGLCIIILLLTIKFFKNKFK